MAILSRSNFAGSHWYTRDGRPMHTVDKKNAADGVRNTNIADARKLGLLPSVTNILGVLAKPALDRYKQEQVVRACLASAKTAEESDEYYIKRILDQAQEPVMAAADIGTNIHAALELAMADLPYDEQWRPYVEPVVKWRAERKYKYTDQEVVLINNRYGYAGRVDALFTKGLHIGVVDYKTRKTKEGKKVEAYDGWGEQLAAYAAAKYGASYCHAKLINVVISSTEPGRIDVVSHEENVRLWATFKAACTVWRAYKQYDPRLVGNP